jgi:glutathione peroxidase-family protein
MATAYDFSARDIDGHEQSLADYRGKVLKRYAPTDTPDSLAKDIEAALA